MSLRNRVYVGNLSSRTRERDLEYEFERYGDIRSVSVKNGFAFVEFRDDRDASDAVRDMDGRSVDGRRLQVELAKGPRPNGAGGRGGGGGGGGNGHRVRVEGLDGRTSWQDLKDFARRAGSVTFTNVFTERGEKCGVIEYPSRSDVKNAIRELDDTTLDGCRVRLYAEDEGRGGSRSRSRSRGRDRSRSRSRGRGKDRSRSRSRGRGKDRSRSRSRGRGKDRSPSPKRSPSRSRSRSPKRSRSDSPKRNDDKDDKRSPKRNDKDDKRSSRSPEKRSPSRSRSRSPKRDD